MRSIDRSLLSIEARSIATQLEAEVISVDYIERGVMTHKFLVSTSDRPMIVRFYPPGRSHVVDFEPDLWRQAQAIGVAVPEVVSDSRTGPPSSLAYVVYYAVPGEPLDSLLPSMSESDLHAIVCSMGEQVALLGRLRVEGFGGLIAEDRARFPSFTAFADDAFERGFDRLRREIALPDIELLRDVTADVERLGARPVIIWGDLSTSNVVVGADGRPNLLDFEGAIGGHPQASLGYAQVRHDGSKFAEAIEDVLAVGWQRGDRTIAAVYGLIRGLRLAVYAMEPLPTGTPRLPITAALPGLQKSVRTLYRELDFRNT